MIRQSSNGFFSKPYLVRIHGIVVLILTVIAFTSCAPTKTAYYFRTLQKDTTLSGLVNKELDSKIIAGDKLRISINSLNKQEDELYSLKSEAGITAQTGYDVSREGTILVHKIGQVHAAGLTRKELAMFLQKELTPYLKDPIVSVEYLNHKVTVTGEVEHPQVINLADEQISLIDALVISGDVKQTARRDHIMVIREEANQKKVKILNLEDHSIFSSPWYYLKPNDIVYVIPDEAKRQREEKRARFQSTFAIAVSTVSLLVIILDRIFR